VVPWVLAERSKVAKSEHGYHRDTQTWHKILNCDHCKPDQRPGWGCGRLPESERTGLFRAPISWPEFSVCPGYLISLPVVVEVCRAHSWWDKGQLQLFLRGEVPSAALVDAIDVLQGAQNALETHQAFELSKPTPGR